MTNRRGRIVVFAVMLGIAGCSGSSKDSAGTSGSTSAATPGGRPSSPSPTGAASASPRPGQTVLRPGDLVDAPEGHLNRVVEVEIVEPLSGPPTPAALASAVYGQVRVEIPDAIG